MISCDIDVHVIASNLLWVALIQDGDTKRNPKKIARYANGYGGEKILLQKLMKNELEYDSYEQITVTVIVCCSYVLCGSR